MGYETSRSLISVSNVNVIDKTVPEQTNSPNIDYKIVTCNNLKIKLPCGNNLYSAPHFAGAIEDLFLNRQTEPIRYYDRDFHVDMKLISKLNPNILFGINSIISEHNSFYNEYYLNGKLLVDEAKLVYQYKDEKDVLATNPEQWQEIVTE